MADEKFSNKGEGVSNRGGNGIGLPQGLGASGLGWVVVAFIGPAGLDVSQLAARTLLGPSLRSAALASIDPKKATKGRARKSGGTKKKAGKNKV